MASAPHQAVMLQYLKMALQSGHGAAAAGLPLFEAAGINSIGSLTSFRPSFRNQSYIVSELAELESALRGATPATVCPAWPSAADTTAILKKILIAAHELSAAQEAAVVAALATQPTGAVTSTAAIALGVAQYKIAEQVHHESYLASERVQYELVGKAYKALQDGRPVSVVLEDIVLELASRSTKSDAVYTIAGKDFVAKDASDKAITIVSFEDLYQQMERRAHMLSVASCFSHADLMTKTGAPAPDPELIRKESTTRYVTTDASGNMTAKTMDLFGSPRILETQISKMKELRSQQPHLTVAQLRAIDLRINKRISDLVLKGYSLDAATFQCVEKSPELYSTAGLPVSDKPSESPSGASTSSGKKRAADRTPDEAAAAYKKTLEQKEREIANLKSGKKSGGKGQGRGANGGGRGTPHPPAGPPPSGTPRVECPPNICKEFNFWQTGCSRGDACKHDHICCKCGGDHPYIKGNH